MTSEHHHESKLPPESLPWGRDTDQSISELRIGLEQLKQSYSNAAMSAQSTLNTGIKETQSAISLIPITVADNATVKALGLTTTGAYVPLITFSLPVPEGKTSGFVNVQGAGHFWDLTTGGTAEIFAAIRIGGVPSVPFPSAKYDSSSFTRNICYPTFGRRVSNLVPATLGGQATVEVRLEIYASDATAFGAQVNNFVTLTATGVFS